jgi:hypothetical protein
MLCIFCFTDRKKRGNEMKKSNRITLYKRIWCKIRYYQQLHNIDDTVLAGQLQVHERTLHEYDKNAVNVTMGKVDSFLYANGITLEELLNS